MKMKTKHLLLAAMFFLAAVLPMGAQTAIPNSTLTWTLADGTLTIDGTGKMPTWTSKDSQPWAAQRTTITSVTIAEGVTSIGQDAFHACSNLQSVTIPSTVTAIGGWAFFDCSNLTSITLPAGLTTIGNDAFYGCSSLREVYNLSKLTLTKGSVANGCVAQYALVVHTDADAPSIEYVQEGDWLFAYYNNTGYVTDYTGEGGAVTVPASFTYGGSAVAVEEIATAVFQNKHEISSITIPAGLTTIGSEAFANCMNLSSITLPAGLTTIGSWAFINCSSLTSITLPTGLTTIGDEAFAMCRGLSLTLPAGLTTIGRMAFVECSSLTSLTLPAGLTNIGEAAFIMCHELRSITALNPIPADISEMVFMEMFDCTLTVANSAVAAYQAAAGWNQLTIVGGGYSVLASTSNAAYGTVSGSEIYAQDAEVSLTVTPAEGCEFVGWVENGNIVSTNQTYTFAATADRTLTAAFNVTVTFDSKDGSVIEPQTVAEGALAVCPLRPTKTGNIFVGWYNGDAEYDFATPVAAPITLTAQWTPDLTAEVSKLVGDTVRLYTANTALVGDTVRLYNANISLVNDTLRLSAEIEALLRQLENCGGGDISTRVASVSKSNVTVYPNPTADILHIDATDGEVPQVRIFNLQGVLQQQLQSNTVNLASYADGVYLIEINGETHTVVKK